MSSKLMPPNVGSSAAMMSTSLSGSCSLISMSNTSMPANFLNNTPLPSITGLLACAPMLPKPSTAVPLEITATKLPLAVYLYASAGLAWISMHGAATPGEYANAKSCCVANDLVGVTLTLPGTGNWWKSNAACFNCSSIFMMCAFLRRLEKSVGFNLCSLFT